MAFFAAFGILYFGKMGMKMLCAVFAEFILYRVYDSAVTVTVGSEFSVGPGIYVTEIDTGYQPFIQKAE